MTANDDSLAALREEHGERWRVWAVNRAVSRPHMLWCAKLWDDPRSGSLIHADSAKELGEAIMNAEAAE